MTNSSIIAAGVGATFSLLRLGADLISKASQAAKVNDEKIENAKPKENDSDAAAAAAADRRASMMSTRRFSLVNINGRMSMANIYGYSGRRQSVRNTVDAIETTKDEETAEEVAEEPKSKLEASLPTISLVIHLILFGYFLSATILSSIGSHPAYIYAIYDSIPLGCATVAVFLGIVSNLSDFQRARFSSLQRMLYSMSALILWSGCIVTIALPPSSTAMTSGNTEMTAVDIATIACLSIHAILAIAEGRIFRKPSVSSKDGKKAKLNKRALLIILKPYFWPNKTATSATLNRIRAITTWACVICAKVCSLTSPILLGTATTALTRFDYETAIRYSIYYAILQLAASTFKECQSLVYLRVGQAAFVQLSELSFNHLHSLSLDWHLKKKLGEVIRSMDRGIAACDMLMKYLFLWLVPAIAEMILVTIIFASYFDFFPIAMSVFFFVIIYMFWTIVLTLWRKKFRKQVAKSDNDWHDKCTDSLVNFETVKYFTAEEYEKNRFAKSVETFQKGSVNVQGSLSFLNISQQVLLQCCLATNLSLAVISVRNRQNCCVAAGCDEPNSACCSALEDICPGLEVGDFTTVLVYTINLFMPLNYLGSVYNMIVMSLVDLANLSELLAENPDVTDVPDAVEMPPKSLDDTAVEFDDVRFHYPTQPDTKGLKGLSFKMKRGTVTAVVGPTGEGKTTVSRLLFRFYDVLGGAVKVNGMDVRSIKQKSLRGAIGVVPQNTSLFNDTLRNNIRYGNQDATDDEIMKVVNDAQLTKFVDSLPEGLDTIVGDRGLKLSGGEKQRTAIARCLLKNPSIVALDTVTENSVQDALDRLGNDRTVLVIAHRLGTIRNADNIIVLGDGKVAEEGTHDDLLALNGKYAEMWNMQLHSTRENSQLNLTELDAA
ncbi:hypothetical protein ACHAWO_002662 [Cyclotella atomus]|uniref:Uncharacterized protein n=1 Tax=Cyclotella atomus TaxID=382360 RepID=A0ABD3P2X2_9STRA